MPDTAGGEKSLPFLQKLTKEETKSLTHGDFWIPEAEREIYKRALRTLNEAGVPYVVAGAYAIYEHTGIYRKTTDLDLFVEPAAVVPAMRALREGGFRTCLSQSHWLAKAKDGEYFVDIIYGMGNGLALIDPDWYRYSSPAILAATPVRVAPAEELIWHRLFINERHRQDMADIAHLILCVGGHLDWERLVEKTGPHWPLLLAQIQMFYYVYPGYRSRVPDWVLTNLLDRARSETGREEPDEMATRGTLISRFSFAIDVNEWGFQDMREDSIRAMKASPEVRRIVEADVWDECAPEGTSGSGVPDEVPTDEIREEMA
ncbi:MAG TPA: hypothetical protein VGR37_22500 [Longimicrobiaceae bacterium]|nr:hypothetical protein [Longimicrobiaceae bacterium]